MVKDKKATKGRWWKRFLIILGCVVIFFLWVIFAAPENHGQKQIWGVTFTPSYAQYLGLDWKETYQAILDDLKVRNFRLAAYWDRIQPAKDKYDFSEVDYELDEAEKRDAKVILVIGRRAPRWPECHTPDWAASLAEADQEKDILDLLTQEIDHFKNRPSIVAWQVENEPLLNIFGVCPKASYGFLRQEVNLVRDMDTRPIMLTESGELSTWVRSGILADMLGISLYHKVYDPYFGMVSYPWGPWFYIRHAQLLSPFVKQIIISELQAEPWFNKPIQDTSLAEQRKIFNSQDLENNINIARRTGFSQVYLWGVEYWYYLKKAGDDSFWNVAKELYKG